MSLALESSHPIFDENSPPIHAEQAIAKYHAWHTEQDVVSTMHAIGKLPCDLGAELLASRRILGVEYGPIIRASALYAPATALLAPFEELVYADMQRSGLEGELKFAVKAGHYRTYHCEPWHSDNFGPSIRWTAAKGVGSTRGAQGTVNIRNTIPSGDIADPHALIGNGRRLQELWFPEGTVTRFTNSGDIHSGAIGTGARILLQATLKLQA